MTPTAKPISRLRQRMIEDMALRKLSSKTHTVASRWRKVCIASDLDAMEAFPPDLVVSGVI